MDKETTTTELWPEASRSEMDEIFQLCRNDDWNRVLHRVKTKPWIAITPMIMDNHIATTVMHQAITSKGSTKLRAQLIRQILTTTPQAAAIKNGYGSLPLHVIAQRNTKMDAPTKESLIFDLVAAHEGALIEEGGVGKRTPLHIIFTDYISPRLTQMMIDHGKEACFMKDKKGFLPAHVACSRHCSPEKLRMVLAVNPDSLYDKTLKGDTLLSLATSTATKSHPNYALIDELQKQLRKHSDQASPTSAAHGTDTVANMHHPSFPSDSAHHFSERHHHPYHRHAMYSSLISPEASSDASSRGRLDSNDSNRSWPPVSHGDATSLYGHSSRMLPSYSGSTTNDGMATEEGHSSTSMNTSSSAPLMENPAQLLLHFSRHQATSCNTDDPNKATKTNNWDNSVKNITQV